MQRIRRKLLRAFGVDPHYPDMFQSERERFFADLYLQKIRTHLKKAFGEKKVDILDAGCQAGRLAIPLAKEGHRVTGIDTSAFALKRATAHCREEGVSISFQKGDVLKVLQKENRSFDAILCVEVLYLRSAYREFLQAFRRRLRSGGLLIVTHRTKFFYMVQALKQKDLESALFVLEHPEGKLWDSYFNWQTAEELRHLYQEIGFPDVSLYPIGTFSEILVDPETLSPEDRRKLFQLEDRFTDERTGCARYVLACAQKDR